MTIAKLSFLIGLASQHITIIMGRATLFDGLARDFLDIDEFDELVVTDLIAKDNTLIALVRKGRE